MNLSREQLLRLSEETGFQSNSLEKSIRLLDLLKEIQEHRDLKDKLVLKGGTAINLFYFDAPRLSVDIDLNYVEARDREEMERERPRIEQAVEQVFERIEMSVSKKDLDSYASSKWHVTYQSPEWGRDTVKVDLNFLMRVPLFPLQKREPVSFGDLSFPAFWVQDLHELTAGKLRALIERDASRDLYDGYRLLHEVGFKNEWLRPALMVYGVSASNYEDWRNVTVNDIGYNLDNVTERLLPMLREEEKQDIDSVEEWSKNLVRTCRGKLDELLPWDGDEIDFLDGVYETGDIRADRLTDDPDLQQAIRHNRGIWWELKKRGLLSDVDLPE